MKRFLTLFCCLLGFFSTDLAVLYARPSYGNLRVEMVDRVHDGDTFIAEISGVHPIIGKEISIRIKGIDAPEMTDQRQDVRELAVRARDYVAHRLEQAKVIELFDIQRDKYFRILADVYVDGVHLGEELLLKGFAKPYHGKTKPQWYSRLNSE